MPMKTIKAELSVDSFQSLINEINLYKSKIESCPSIIVDRLSLIALNEIKGNILNITDVDGNYLANASRIFINKKALIYMYGRQSSYLEYGTGYIGKESPHPQAAEAGWQYDIGVTIRTTKKGRRVWKYYDNGKMHWRTTGGIPAQMPVLKASISVRKKAIDVISDVINEVVN